MSKRILVIGESCRDILIYCDAVRLAPDVPIPVLHVVRTTRNPGMAKNVERNVKALHRNCDLITNPNWRSITKTRYVYDKTIQSFFRVDAPHDITRLNVRRVPLRQYDIIAVSDYHKGFLTHDDIRYICERHPCVLVDTKKPIGSFLQKAAFIKINRFEYERSGTIPPRVARKIICTMGDDGARYNGRTYPVEHVEVKDPSGAGDSFFAALLVHYAKTGSIEDAIHFANKCATHVVQQRGVTIIARPK